MDDYLDARPVSTPFGLYDCDVPVDGSIAFVVSAADHADDCPSRAVRIEAMGGSDGAGGWFHRADYPRMASVEAASQMWSRTDLRPEDVDIAELYDGFTFLTFAWLEALGLCEEGVLARSSKADTASDWMVSSRSTPTVVSCQRGACMGTGCSTRHACSFEARPETGKS